MSDASMGHFFELLNIPYRFGYHDEETTIIISAADFAAKRAKIEPWFRVIKQDEQEVELSSRPGGTTEKLEE